jgi:hypothetical protein
MSIAIIAASLVVMRPCFRAIHRAILPNGHTHTALSSYYPSENVSSAPSNGSRERRTGITKTVEIEMAVKSGSTEDILTSEDQF